MQPNVTMQGMEEAQVQPDVASHNAASVAHLILLKRSVALQKPAQDFVKSLLERMARNALSHQGTEFSLEFFGSRRYEVALPNSDVDIVCILPQVLHDISKQKFLTSFLSRMSSAQEAGDDPACSILPTTLPPPGPMCLLECARHDTPCMRPDGTMALTTGAAADFLLNSF